MKLRVNEKEGGGEVRHPGVMHPFHKDFERPMLSLVRLCEL